VKTIPLFDADIRAKAREAVILGAEWHRHNQVRHSWPYWTADAGRFNSLVNARGGSEPPLNSICWNTARGAQAVLSAYKLTGDPSMLETARLAMEYVKTCQIFQPEFAEHHGACVEETPLADHIASRDTVEAIQGFVNLYSVSRDPVCLQRAVAGADWFVNRYFKGGGYPNGYIMHLENGRGIVSNDFSRLMLAAAVLPLAQLDALTGKTAYAPSALRMRDWVVDHALEPDGAIKIHDGTRVGHHAVQNGPLADCFTNDDGVGIALIAAYHATGQEKYREAVERNGRWWLAMKGFPDTFASVPAGLLFLVEMARFTDDKAYIDKALPYIERVLSVQHHSPYDPIRNGGFKGHDIADNREKALLKTDAGDYISHRTTMYAMMALAKVATEKDK
jgi:hypothetical protein